MQGLWPPRLNSTGWSAGLVFGVAVLSAMAPAEARAQAPLVDYESSAKIAQVRDAAAWRLAFRPPLQVLQQTVGQLRNAPGVSPQVRSEADRLIAVAGSEPEAEAHRTLWRAVTILNGQAWSADQERLGALALRTPKAVWTGAAADDLVLEALYQTVGGQPLTYSLDLVKAEPTTSATPQRGAVVRTVAKGQLTGSYPQRLAVDVSDQPDGAYLLVAQIKGAAGASTEIAQSIYLVRNLDARQATLKAALDRVAGHAEAKWIAEYPYALAKALNSGQREVISYDFPAAMGRSAEIAAALAAGRDPVRQATGLQNRAYRFPETGELVPYQLYVPTSWTPGKRWPLVVALHGANLDETNMLGRDDGRMQKLAEAHGFIVAAPLGYRLNSAYGSERGFSRAIVGEQAERRRRSEEDVLRVTELVEREYNVDPSRRYLTGNSMGGGGTWWIGGKYPDRWAALAPAAYGGVLPQDVPNLGRSHLMVVVGDHDDLMLERVRESVATLRAGGVNPQYVEVPGGTHASGFEIALPQIFEFFEKQVK